MPRDIWWQPSSADPNDPNAWTLATGEVPFPVPVPGDVEYRVKDGTGDTHLVTPTRVAPVAAGALADQTFDENTGVQTYDTSDDFTGNALVYSLQSSHTGVTINSGTGVVSIDTDATGTLSGAGIVVRATNSGGFADSAFSLTVEVSIAAPTVATPIPDQTKNTADTTTVIDLTEHFAVESDPTLSTLTELAITSDASFVGGVFEDGVYIDDSIPEGITVSLAAKTLTLDWSVIGEQDSLSVTVRATNPGGSVSDTFQINVTQPDLISPTGDVASIWLGAVDSTSIALGCSLNASATGTVRHCASLTDDFANPIYSAEVSVTDPGTPNRFGKTEITGLAANTTYHHGVEVNGVIDSTRLGTFKTAPASGSFKLAFASCANTGSNALIFDTIAAEGALAFVHTGDLHYEDIGTDPPVDAGAGYEPEFHAAFDSVFGSARQNSLWRNLPMLYMWDDHDYGPNDSGASSPSRTASVAAYRSRVPSPSLALSGATDAVYYTHKIGRFRIVMLDPRSERFAETINGESAILRQAQEDWLIGLAQDAAADEVLLIGTGVPWEAANGIADTWGMAPIQRQRIYEALNARIRGRYAFFAGDMHNVAYKAISAYGGAPVYQAAPLDRASSNKGGPWGQIGTNPGTSISRYATFDLSEIEGGGQIIYRAYDVDRSTGTKTELFNHTIEMKEPPPPAGIEVLGSTTFVVPAGASTAQYPLPASQEGDVVLVAIGSDANFTSSAYSGNSGWTALHGPVQGNGFVLLQKVMGATPDTTITLTPPGATADQQIAGLAQTIRGVDTATPQDATLQFLVGPGTGMPNPPALTTVTDGALRVIVGFLDDQDVASTVTAPSGFGNLVVNDTGRALASDNGATVMMAFRLEPTAGALDPSAFGGDGDDNTVGVHFALRPGEF